MATPFSEIFDRAICRFSDYDFLKYTDAIREGLLEKYLFSAQSEFQKVSSVKLSDRDDVAKQYNQTLDEDCIETLSLGVAYYWVSSKALNSELMKNSLKTSEYSMFSPAELLKQIQVLRDSLKREFKSRIIEYSWNNSDVADLKV